MNQAFMVAVADTWSVVWRAWALRSATDRSAIGHYVCLTLIGDRPNRKRMVVSSQEVARDKPGEVGPVLGENVIRILGWILSVGPHTYHEIL